LIRVTPETAYWIAHDYISDGLNRALFDKKRPGDPYGLSGRIMSLSHGGKKYGVFYYI